MLSATASTSDRSESVNQIPSNLRTFMGMTVRSRMPAASRHHDRLPYKSGVDGTSITTCAKRLGVGLSRRPQPRQRLAAVALATQLVTYTNAQFRAT